jgi:hypothetical protein
MSTDTKLDLRPGEWVEVLSQAEILATLRHDGTLDGLPFMPEMLAHCGRRYQVFRRADKTCDTVTWTGLRRMERTVHLTTLRCDGSSHAGCQAACLLFWKEAWLRRVAPDAESNSRVGEGLTDDASGGSARDRRWLEATIYGPPTEKGETCYRCQATEVVKASRPLPWWQPGQYVRDVYTNHMGLGDVLRGVAMAAYSKVHRLLTGHAYPNVSGTLKKTPTETLGLKGGEWVVVKSKEEILATLDVKSRNRGLSFDAEMLPYCGQRCRVQGQVERIIQESTGRLVELPGVSLILENVVCRARYRRSCPRSIFPYWREIWLRRADAGETAGHLEGRSWEEDPP